MKAAAKSIDITPPAGLPIGGNVRDDDIARGVHDNLYCNAILLEEEGKRICFISFDLLGVTYETCEAIKIGISQKTGIGPENILICATHTHSGPDVLGIFREKIDDRCKKYLEETIKKVADEIALLPSELKDACLSIAKSHVYDLSFNRRLIMKDGSMKMNFENPDIDDVEREAGPIDPELYALVINDTDNNPIAIIINFTLHPAILVGKDWLWSRDYINYLTNDIKKHLGNNTVVFFANGAEGNVNHINYKDKSQGRGFEEAERIGSSLANYVIEALNTKKPFNILPFKCISKKIKLPLREITKEDVLWAKKIIKERGDFIPSLLDGVPDEIYAREILKLSKIKDKEVETEIQVIRIGDVLIATLPGEVFVEFGLRIKQSSPFENTMVFGLANDMVGYVPTEVAFSEGGYEIKTAWSSKLDPKAGEILLSHIVDLIDNHSTN
ncbi:MAG TPA: hypothetical protein GXX37_14845 [Clostridiaceae bacterium]|nr:hypothetical protein [Clostridiaceae bacterium]